MGLTVTNPSHTAYNNHHNNNANMLNLLSIGGSDPSSGAGIQADVKTFSSYNAYALTVTTALTAQNTVKFTDAEPVSTNILKAQLDAILSDFKISGIKIGMVYESDAIKIISKKILPLVHNVPIVVDPVIYSTTGGVLLKESALKDFIKYMVPLATVITPNKQEAHILANTTESEYISDYKKMASHMIQKLRVKSAIITGIPGCKPNTITDMVIKYDKNRGIRTYLLDNYLTIHGDTHGSGCAHSAILLCEMANGKPILKAAKAAQKFITQHIQNSLKIGTGVHIVSADTEYATNNSKQKLVHAIDAFCQIKYVHKCIPECQTNFVYSEYSSPHNTKEILGIKGRIVRTGNTVTIAGDITYGGSKHVATALMAMCQKFPHIKSAVNIKYSQEMINAINNSNMKAVYYDRRKEPKEIKFGEQKSSIQWGVTDAIKDLKVSPDAICHNGDYGKEPMIIVFGTTPNKVVSKIKKILTKYTK